MAFLVVWVSCTTTKSTRSVDPTRLVPELSTLDRFGNVYVVNTVNELVKYDEKDEKFGYYTNNTLGEVGYIDITNPLKVLIYYPAFYTAVFLDRQLRETSQVDFLELGLGEIRTVATALNGSLWIFDYNQQVLKNIDPQGKVLLQSPDLRLTLGQNFDVKKIKQLGNEVYLLTTSGELLVFDIFGYYKRTIELDAVEDFQVSRRGLFLFRKDQIYVLDDTGLELNEVDQAVSSGVQKMLFGNGFRILVNAHGYKRLQK